MNRRGVKWLQRWKNVVGRCLPGYHAAPELTSLGGSPAYGASGVRKRLLFAAAVVALLLVPVICWSIWTVNYGTYWRARLQSSLLKADYVQAQSVAERLRRHSPDDLDLLWNIAFIEERLDRDNVAADMRGQLAKRGYEPAVHWSIEKKLRLEQVNEWTEDQHAEFLSLFNHQAKWSPEIAAQLNRHLAAYWTVQGEFTNAIRALGVASRSFPAAHVNIATLYLQMGDRSEAEKHADIGRMELHGRINKVPTDAESRLQLVQALVILGQEAEALVLLADGFDLTHQPSMQQAAGEVLVSWAARLQRINGVEATFWKRLQLTHSATQCAPNNSNVLSATLNLIDECIDHESRMDELREAAARGIERVAAHSMLGWVHACNNQRSSALQHLQVAMSDAPETPTVLNNLALALMNRQNPPLDRALVTIDLAVALSPDQPQFLETRGRVLNALQRWEETIEDVEIQ